MDDYKNYCVKNDSIYDSPTRTFSENCLYSRSFDMQLRHRELVLSSRTESISGFPTGQIFLHHRIGWWENLQESPIFEDFDGKNLGLPVNFPFNQSSDYRPPFDSSFDVQDSIPRASWHGPSTATPRQATCRQAVMARYGGWLRNPAPVDICGWMHDLSV